MTLNTATSQAAYRERTEQQDKSTMNTVASYYTFMCPECGNRRPIRGRVSRGWKAGFRCASCHEEKTKAAAWKLAQKQANHLPEIKSEAVKDRQIVMLCETLKKALGNK